MIEQLANPEIWVALATLTALELVLGIDNIIFISILVDKLPPERREVARKLGLFMAMFMRLARPWKNSQSSMTSLPSGGATMRGAYCAHGRGVPRPKP